ASPAGTVWLPLSRWRAGAAVRSSRTGAGGDSGSAAFAAATGSSGAASDLAVTGACGTVAIDSVGTGSAPGTCEAEVSMDSEAGTPESVSANPRDSGTGRGAGMSDTTESSAKLVGLPLPLSAKNPAPAAT